MRCNLGRFVYSCVGNPFQWPQIGRVRCNQDVARPRRLRPVSMASNRPGEMQQPFPSVYFWSCVFQWPQIGRVRCNTLSSWPCRAVREFQWPQIGRVRCNQVEVKWESRGTPFQWPQIGRVRCNNLRQQAVARLPAVSMASNRPGEMQLAMAVVMSAWAEFQWPQIGRVRCNKTRFRSCRQGERFNGLKSAG